MKSFEQFNEEIRLSISRALTDAKAAVEAFSGNKINLKKFLQQVETGLSQSVAGNNYDVFSKRANNLTSVLSRTGGLFTQTNRYYKDFGELQKAVFKPLNRELKKIEAYCTVKGLAKAWDEASKITVTEDFSNGGGDHDELVSLSSMVPATKRRRRHADEEGSHGSSSSARSSASSASTATNMSFSTNAAMRQRLVVNGGSGSNSSNNILTSKVGLDRLAAIETISGILNESPQVNLTDNNMASAVAKLITRLHIHPDVEVNLIIKRWSDVDIPASGKIFANTITKIATDNRVGSQKSDESLSDRDRKQIRDYLFQQREYKGIGFNIQPTEHDILSAAPIAQKMSNMAPRMNHLSMMDCLFCFAKKIIDTAVEYRVTPPTPPRRGAAAAPTPR